METRNPKQKRAIEKKRKIIETGFNLICEKGYHNINTNDIAKASNLSVGILYQYFKDKKEIFLEGLRSYSEDILFPISNIIEKKNFNNHDLKNIINEIINYLIKKHNISRRAHQEILSLQRVDKDVEKIFLDLEINFTNKICRIINDKKIHFKNMEEKVHVSYNLIEMYVHEVIYHKHNNLDYEIMKNTVINMILSILND